MLQIVVLEKTLESPLKSKEIKLVNLELSQPWIFTEKTDAKVELPIFWPSDVNCWLIGKDPDAGKDWGQEEKGTTEEMVGWHHQLDGHESKQALGIGDNREGWYAAVCGIAKNQTGLSDWSELMTHSAGKR